MAPAAAVAAAVAAAFSEQLVKRLQTSVQQLQAHAQYP